jgi:hypothetical protein
VDDFYVYEYETIWTSTMCDYVTMCECIFDIWIPILCML